MSFTTVKYNDYSTQLEGIIAGAVKSSEPPRNLRNYDLNIGKLYISGKLVKFLDSSLCLFFFLAPWGGAAGQNVFFRLS